MSDPKDGFDLLEYPCDYQFKAMVRVAGLEEAETAKQAMKTLIETGLSSDELLAVSSSSSRTGKFEAISLTVRLTSREQLEAVYALLASDPNVVMTL